MTDDIGISRTVADRDNLPADFPTHRHDPQFWEMLGRTIATFGFLEEMLGKAIFAYSATTQYPADKVEAAYAEWLPLLEKALTDQLWNLAETFGKVAQANSANSTQNIDELVAAIQNATAIRNVLCHGSWRLPDDNGASVPFFVNRKKEIFDSKVDLAYLHQVQAHVADLAISIVDTVTHMGWQFPGGAGPGKSIVRK